MGLTLQFQIYSDALKTQEDMQIIGSSFSCNNKNAHENWEQRSQNVNQVVPNSRFSDTYKQLLLHRATTHSPSSRLLSKLWKKMRKKGLSSHIPPQITSTQRTKNWSSDRRNVFEEISNFLSKKHPHRHGSNKQTKQASGRTSKQGQVFNDAVKRRVCHILDRLSRKI